MATGTGKTYTAIGCLQKVLEKHERLLCTIVCPYTHIVKQWSQSIKNFGIDIPIIVADSSNAGWKDKLTDVLTDIELNRKKRIVVITTYNTFCGEFFTSMFKDRTENTLLIADEMHWSGAKEFQKGLNRSISIPNRT